MLASRSTKVAAARRATAPGPTPSPCPCNRQRDQVRRSVEIPDTQPPLSGDEFRSEGAEEEREM